MEGPDHERLPEDLERIAARLRAERGDLDPLKLDQLKQTAIARYNSRDRRRTSMRSRLAAILTSLALVGGAGGALAISQVGTHSDTHGGAADAQYKHHKHHKHKKCKFEGKGKHRHKVCVGGKHKHKKHHKKHHKKPACDRDRNHEGDAPGHEGPGEHRTCH